jgi:hypothetical protein
MSIERINKKNGWGGPRKDAGRKKTGVSKIKICVSVSEKLWQDALRSWTGKASHLVEKLVCAYVNEGKAGQKSEAIT